MTQTLLDDDKDQNIDPNKDYLEELIGEGGKFYDLDRDKALQKLARGKVEADAFIKFKNGEYDKLSTDYLVMREDSMGRAKLEDLINQIKVQQHTSNDNTQNVNDVNNKPGYDPKEIESLIDSRIQETEQAKRQQENFNSVKGKLKERYGDSSTTVLKQHMDNLGLTQEELDDLARRRPAVLIKALGLDVAPTQDNLQAPPRTSQRTDPFSPNVNKRTWAYYEKMRKEQPEVYTNSRTQTQLLKDAAELGDAFKDGNWQLLNK